MKTSKSWPPTSQINRRPSRQRPRKASRDGARLSAPLRLKASIAQHHQKLRERFIVSIAVVFLAIPMAFVGREQVPDFSALRAQFVHDLFRLGDRHSRIVFTMHDEQRSGDSI